MVLRVRMVPSAFFPKFSFSGFSLLFVSWPSENMLSRTRTVLVRDLTLHIYIAVLDKIKFNRIGSSFINKGRCSVNLNVLTIEVFTCCYSRSIIKEGFISDCRSDLHISEVHDQPLGVLRFGYQNA